MWIFRPQVAVLKQNGEWRERRVPGKVKGGDDGFFVREGGEDLNRTLFDSCDVVPSDRKFGTVTGRDGKERWCLLGNYEYKVPLSVAKELAEHWPQWLFERADPPPSRRERKHAVVKSGETLAREANEKIEALTAQVADLNAMVTALTSPKRKVS